jgi:Ca2+-binding RTX toxin-like protein
MTGPASYAPSMRLGRRSVVCLLLIAAILVPGDGADARRRRKCFGRRITKKVQTGIPFVGTPGNDVIRGTNGDDQIDGGGGRDRICGRGGEDTIEGGLGNDRIDGGSGSDHLVGDVDGTTDTTDTSGNDLIRGGSEIDYIVGDSIGALIITNDDVVVVGGGDDSIDGGKHGAVVVGDSQAYSASPDYRAFATGGGDDTIRRAGPNFAYGDSLAQATAAVASASGAGSDSISYSFAGPADQLVGDSHAGGAAGSTTDSSVGSGGHDRIATTVLGSLIVGDHLLLGASPITFGAGNDVISGSGGGDSIYADTYSVPPGTSFGTFGGHDRISANAGDDNVHAGPGDDQIDGGAGTDECDGEDGTDTHVNCETFTGFP